MIEVKNLVKDYGGHMAVDHLNFTIKDGQIYGFLGPNGAGKSTTMNIMTGYIGATGGDILINGHNILEEPEEAKKCIGYLPEVPPLYVDMTVREQLEFAAELKKIPKNQREKAILQVVGLAKLESVYGRLVRNLSKGYRQRVGLAQAVLGMPPVIILDEPTVGLDPKQIIEIRDTIRQLGRKHTVILSSHILSEVSAICDHIMIIDHGKLIASDTPENLERQMAGEASMELLVKGGEGEIKSLLSPISGIGEMAIKDSKESGVKKVTFRLMSENESRGKQEAGLGGDVREAIFFAFADRRIPLLSMRTIKVSLEEVFLRLTGDDGVRSLIEADETENQETENQEANPPKEAIKEEGMGAVTEEEEIVAASIQSDEPADLVQSANSVDSAEPADPIQPDQPDEETTEKGEF